MFKNIFGRKKKTIFISWLFSYVLVLLLPIFISSLIYIKSVDIVKGQLKVVNKALLKQVQQTLDSKMKDVIDISWQINENPRIISAIYSKADLDSDRRYSLYQVGKDLEGYQLVTNEIEDIFIYLKNNDVVLGKNFINTRDDFYNIVYPNRNISFNDWSNIITNCKTLQYEPFSYRENTNSDKLHKVIEFLEPLPIGNKGDSQATLAILIDEKKIDEAIESMKLLNHSNIFIINENNKIISSTNDSKILPKGITYNTFKNDTDFKIMNCSEGKVAVSCITSDFLKWKYISIIPENYYMEQVRYIQKLSLLSISLCLFLGLIISYVFSKKNYDPVNKLTKKISTIFKVDYKRESNEFNYIEATLEKEANERKSILEKLQQQNRVLKYNFLAKLLKGKVDNSISLSEALTTLDIKLDKENFAVALIYIENCSELFFKNSTHEEISIDDNFKLLEFTFENVVNDIFIEEYGEGNNIYVIEVNDTICCLINYSLVNGHNSDVMLLNLANRVQSFIQDKIHINFSLSISDVHNKLNEIYLAYQEALEAMEYTLINGYSSIISYSSIKISENKYEYSLKTEQQLSNFIKAGDYETSKKLVDKVFESNFSNGYLSIEMTKCLMFDMASTLIKIIAELNVKGNSILISEVNPIKELTKCKTLAEMKTNLLVILENVCFYVNENSTNRNTILKDQIINFVNNNYNNTDLDVSMVAESLNFNQSYLSSFFKETTSEGLLDYINKVRIGHAKLLLEEEDISVIDASTRVGFYNSNSFIRAFKKYEGVTPGIYKKNTKDLHSSVQNQ